MTRFWISGLLLAGLLAFTGSASAQDKKDEKKDAKPPIGAADAAKKAQDAAGGPPQMDPEMMKKMMEAAMPGAHHKHLEPLAGKWTYELKWWMPGAPEPEKSAGKSETKWMHDGRFLIQEVEGPEEPGFDGKPMKFRGTGITGYDTMNKEYTNVWFDNMGTGTMITRGTCDGTGKVITMTGEMPNPMSGDGREKVRTVLKIDGPDKHSFEMYSTPKGGKEMKMMEIVYTRAK